MTFSNTPSTPSRHGRPGGRQRPSVHVLLDLSGLNIGFYNNGGQTRHQQVWITFKITLPTYTSITLASLSSLP